MTIGSSSRVRLFGVDVDAIKMDEAVDYLGRMIQDHDRQCGFVVTPNVDHVVILQQHCEFRAAYREASLVLADGWPLVTASRWLHKPLPERVAGSDLVPALFAAATRARPLRTYLLGAADGVAARAKENIQSRWPAVEVVGVDSPPVGFERCHERNELVISQIAAADPDLLIIGFGAPKQELWVHSHRERIRCRVAICAGATIDFLAGVKRRAPHWMRRLGLEWFYRMIGEPRRLVRRYLRDAVIFPKLVWQEWSRTEVAVAGDPSLVTNGSNLSPSETIPS